MENLDDKLSVQISSEQVIPTITRAVKELVENSIDAGASSIEIQLSRYGTDKIEVIDDGLGIHPEDHSKLALLGSTSKINKLEDIEQVSTLGFRGQSLAALARLSDMEIKTAHSSSTSYLLKFSRFGELIERSYSSWKSGTSITIKNIFQGLPIRQKDMFSNKSTYLKQIVEMIEEYSLCFNNLKFLLSHQDNSKNEVLVRSSPSDISRLVQKYFKVSNLIEIDLNFTQLNAHVHLTNPYEINKLKNDKTFTFLNKRPINTPRKLLNCVNGLYKQHSNGKMLLIISANSTVKANPNQSKDKRDVDFPNLQLFTEDLISKILAIFEEKSKNIELPRDINNLKRKIEEPKPFDNKKYIVDKPGVFNRYTLCVPSRNNNAIYNKEHRNDTSFQYPGQAKILAFNEKDRKLIQNSEMDEANPVYKDQESKQEANIIQNEPKRAIYTHNQRIQVTLKGKSEETDTNDETQTIDNFSLNEKLQRYPGLENTEYTKLTNENSHSHQASNPYRKPILKWDISQLRRKEKSVASRSLNLSNDCSISNISSISDVKSFNLNFKKAYFKELQVIGQFNNGFILAHLEQSRDLFIIDQHAANEKYLFETMEKSTTIHNQPYLVPQPLSLNISDEIIVSNHLNAFEQNGFKLICNENSPPGKKLSMKTVPFSKNVVFNITDLEDMISKLINIGNVEDDQSVAMLIRPEKYRKMFASRACRKAVMIGDSLNEKRMKQILEDLSGLKKPWNCPHGRPTLRLLYNFNT